MQHQMYHGLIEEILDGPVVGGFLDRDFYDLTMGQFAFVYYPDVEVDFALTNRSVGRERLSDGITEQELGDALATIRDARPGESDVRYIRGTTMGSDGMPMFRQDYVEHLRNPGPCEYQLGKRSDGEFDLHIIGKWSDALFGEVPTLAALSGLRMRNKFRHMNPFEREATIATGIVRLQEKHRIIREHPGLTFTCFSTRRRFHRAWQRYAVHRTMEALGCQFRGTSNVETSRDFDGIPMGTSSHQMFMVVAAIFSLIDGMLRASHNIALQQWFQLYGWELSIALTDAFGTDFFFRDFTPEQAREWKGLRQDSGDPFEFARKAIAFYRKHGINPLDKLIIFSDGLDADLIVRLWLEFEQQIKVTFGWGTLFGNDLGIPALSIVIKAVRARLNANSPWMNAVKLTDNLNKAMGPKADIEHYREVFGHTGTYAAECRV